MENLGKKQLEYDYKQTTIVGIGSYGIEVIDKLNFNGTKGLEFLLVQDLDKEYKERWVRAEQEKLRIEKNIDKVEEPYRTILHMKYIQGKSLEEISCKIKCNYTYACEQHGIALKKYEESRTYPKTAEE
jgi:hypothetical protein